MVHYFIATCLIKKDVLPRDLSLIKSALTDKKKKCVYVLILCVSWEIAKNQEGQCI